MNLEVGMETNWKGFSNQGGGCHILINFSESSRICRVKHVIINKRAKPNNKMFTVDKKVRSYGILDFYVNVKEDITVAICLTQPLYQKSRGL